MSRRCSGLTQLDVLFSLAVIVALATMQLPAVNASREAAQRNACSNKLRQLALSVHNYNSVYQRLPSLAHDVEHLPSLKAASVEGETATRFSWHVRMLPFVEQGAVYNDVSQTSDRFRRPAFDPQITVSGVHPALIPVDVFVCPAFQGKPIATAKEFESLSLPGQKQQDGGVAISNYVALPATHVELLEQKSSEANGVLVPGKPNEFVSVRDGRDKTLLLAETKEQHYASWYDATCSWVVGLPADVQPQKDDAGRWRAPRGTPNPLNYGPTEATKDRVYLASERWANSEPRRWGPSSNHAGGVVMHAVVDGSIRPLKDDIDPTVYLALITRAGSEVIRDDVLQQLGFGVKQPPRTPSPGDVKTAK